MEPKSNLEWKMWGKADPLWAVAAWKDKNKGGLTPWTDQEFYEQGRNDWKDFLVHWEKYGLDNRVALEIGCGAGRLTGPMARSFRKVHALDVSEAMIDYARQHVPDKKVAFSVVDGNRIPLADASVTAVFSAHVFQHLNSLDDATAYFREISRVLREGGSMMIHLPVLAWPVGAPRWAKVPFHLSRSLHNVRASLQRLAIARGKFKPLMVMRSYPMDYLYSTLGGLGFSEIEVLVFAVKSNNDPHPFVMATRGGSL